MTDAGRVAAAREDEAIEIERIGVLERELAASRQQIAQLERRLAERTSDGDIASLREQLVEQMELSETYRIEAADLRSMFAAMEHRIETLQRRAQAPSNDGLAAQRVTELESALAAAEARAEEAAGNESDLREALQESQSTLAATRRARDQWIERLETSGREKADLERRLTDVGHQLAAATASAQRTANLECELSTLRADLEQSERATVEMEKRAASAEAEREQLAAVLASHEERIAASLEACAVVERESESLANSHGEIEQQVAALVDDISTTRQLSDDLCSLLREDRRQLDSLVTGLEERAQLPGELSAARARIAALEEEIASLEKGRAIAAEKAAADREFAEQLAELEAQRSALAEEVERERARRLELERAAQKAAPAADPAAAEAAASQGALATLQQSFDDAVARHAEETRALREDLALQCTLVHEREMELDRLAAECAILQASVETAISDMESVRSERISLSEELQRLEIADDDDESMVDGDLVNMPESGINEGDGATSHGGSAAESEGATVLRAAAEVAGEPLSSSYTVLSIDGDPAFEGAIEEAVAVVPGAVFSTDLTGASPPGGPVQLVINLASDRFRLDLLDKIGHWRIAEPEALTYCGRNGRGVFFRRVMFFPPPCDIDECSTRLLSGQGDTLQRLLVVGEDVDFMSGLRESLGRIRASTAIAFDGRQAIDLMPMVKPQVVLVDLNLPRGDGLRVASQVAANPDLRNVRIGMFWSKAVDPLVFRQQAIYAMRDFRMTPEQLTRSLTVALGVLPNAAPTVGAVPGAILRAGSAHPSANPPGN